MKPDDNRQRVHRYIHQKQQEIQRKFQDFRSQYEHSGKTSFLLAQSECQGAVAAYQDILRMYGMHVTYDTLTSVTSEIPDPTVSGADVHADEMLPVLYAYCHNKYQEARQKNVRCQEQYAVSSHDKYLFLQRQYAGEIMAYQNVSAYIRTLEPPSEIPDTESPAVAESLAPPQSLEESGLRHILVMESSALIRKSIEMILSLEGFTVTTVSDALIGLDIAQKISPDVILMDSSIARRNEEQLVFMLRRERRLRKIPVILLEGSGRSLDEYLNAQLDVIASIKKPFQPDELVYTIRTALSA